MNCPCINFPSQECVNPERCDKLERCIAAAPAPAKREGLREALKKMYALFDNEGNFNEQYQDQCSVALEAAEQALASEIQPYAPLSDASHVETEGGAGRQPDVCLPSSVEHCATCDTNEYPFHQVRLCNACFAARILPRATTTSSARKLEGGKDGE